MQAVAGRLARILRALCDGLRLRCPRCRRGPMFASASRMHRLCPVCGMPFERSSGEVSGGMVINLVVTELPLVLVGGYFGLFTRVPLLPVLLSLALFGILFPIVFYRPSRGLWASILYLTGGNTERD